MKQTIKLRESELKQMIAESVKNILEDTSQTSTSKEERSRKHEERMRARIGQMADQIQTIYQKLSHESAYGPTGALCRNLLAEFVKNEKWVEELGNVWWQMKEFAEAKKPNYGPYEDDPYHFGY